MNKILTVTLNPAIDQFFYVDGFLAGKEQRASVQQTSAGGKGVNVSRALKCLGMQSTATGILGGAAGILLKECLRKEKVTFDFYETTGETRTNITIIDRMKHRQTRMLGPGPEINAFELKRFEAKFIKLALKHDIVSFSGRLGNGIPEEYYRRLLAIAKRHKLVTVIDTSGKPLKAAVESRPYLLKLNLMEIETLLGVRLPTIKSKINAMQEMISSGISEVIMTLGEDGSIGATEGEIISAYTAKTAGVTDVGCGDSFLAGFIYGMNKRLSFVERLKIATASGTANLQTEVPGLISQKVVYKMLKYVKLNALNAKRFK
jgi:tagatose 6-phosphate kinase